MTMQSGYATSAPRRTLSDLQQEMERLSIEERELLHKELYGVATETVIETDEFVQTALHEMELTLQDIIATTRERSSSSLGYGLDDSTILSYIHANTKNPTFVSDPDRRIQFLRCDLFNVKDAAVRYVNYWKERIWLWGDEKAFRKITIQDFDDDDQMALRLGGYQICPMLDQFQRGVVLSDRTKFDLRPTHRKSQLRQLWYILEAAIENINVQKNGIVGIPGFGFRRSSLMEHDRKYDLIAIRIASQALPVRCVAIHHVVSNKMIQYVVPFLLYVLGTKFRKRYKCHTHSASIFDILQNYGISRDIIPQECGGTHPTYNYSEWLASRRAQNL